MIKVALISGGRESTAMGIKKGLDYYHERVFADTGDDPNGLRVVKDLNERFGWNIKIVYSRYGNIREYYENKIVDNEPKFIGHAMPSQANKDCSQKFKIYAISDYLFEKYGKKESFELSFGLSHSKKEIHRMERIKKNQRKLDTCIFPLIDERIDRELCGEICKKAIGYVPERSLCDMCFERTQDDWVQFAKNEPERFASVLAFDESSKLFKKYNYGLANKPLREIVGMKEMPKGQLLLDTKPCACVEDFCLEESPLQNKEKV